MNFLKKDRKLLMNLRKIIKNSKMNILQNKNIKKKYRIFKIVQILYLFRKKRKLKIQKEPFQIKKMSLLMFLEQKLKLNLKTRKILCLKKVKKKFKNLKSNQKVKSHLKMILILSLFSKNNNQILRFKVQMKNLEKKWDFFLI
ncbi:hypothetical protein IMG5_100920 [Ichthyophthirius multifiliis]|uniref:Uncharacterized protein n=1 Tax=Ichthyophthirius multifiliis TaxID=5932 RepID=G0QSG0_ICHMU|nr:hypothetical protein IMG5_100920 [Ichthyophthirius multifiliis]EGR31839.1 hypothetical protein IMG5_100920 [Ichthyophthirius multifiliis]|eukprot:XP_004035325.1 hypothetical protein IMG5_100920 [Ichthyophthirius multifiliis]